MNGARSRQSVRRRDRRPDGSEPERTRPAPTPADPRPSGPPSSARRTTSSYGSSASACSAIAAADAVVTVNDRSVDGDVAGPRAIAARDRGACRPRPTPRPRREAAVHGQERAPRPQPPGRTDSPDRRAPPPPLRPSGRARRRRASRHRASNRHRLRVIRSAPSNPTEPRHQHPDLVGRSSRLLVTPQHLGDAIDRHRAPRASASNFSSVRPLRLPSSRSATPSTSKPPSTRTRTLRACHHTGPTPHTFSTPPIVWITPVGHEHDVLHTVCAWSPAPRPSHSMPPRVVGTGLERPHRSTSLPQAGPDRQRQPPTGPRHSPRRSPSAPTSETGRSLGTACAWECAMSAAH